MLPGSNVCLGKKKRGKKTIDEQRIRLRGGFAIGAAGGW